VKVLDHVVRQYQVCGSWLEPLAQSRDVELQLLAVAWNAVFV